MSDNIKKLNIINNMPLSSSVGHLAYGDLAFKAWREKKALSKSNINKNEK